MRTELCEMLGIDVPILNVGFGVGASSSLAAAVSNAGGCGVIGSAGLPIRDLRQQIDAVRGLTERPFGVNVLLAGLEYPGWAEVVPRQIDVCLEQAAPVLVLFWGDPAPFVEPAHAVDTKVLVQVGSVEEARAAAGAGVDAVIAQGVEAGGHVRGRTSIWEFLPACVEAIRPVPVLASGGIGTGALVARAIAAGAQGVSLGTAFLAAEEANIHADYRRRLLDATAAATVLTDDLFDIGWPDAPHRVLRAKAFEEWERSGRPPSGQRPGEGTPIGRLGPSGTVAVVRYSPIVVTPDFDGDVDLAPLWAGESVESVRDVEPAALIVQRLVREADALLP